MVIGHGGLDVNYCRVLPRKIVRIAGGRGLVTTYIINFGPHIKENGYTRHEGGGSYANRAWGEHCFNLSPCVHLIQPYICV